MQRLNRFVVEVMVEGKTCKAYLNNTGRLTQFLAKGREGFCLRKDTGKTGLRLFSVKEGELGAIVDTRLQTEAFEESLKKGFVPWLDGCRLLRRNVKLGVVEGYLEIPERPGLGVELDERLLSKSAFNPFDLPVLEREDGSVADW